ncbi:MAG: hypothetical protein ACYTG2_07195 [Planctomycetota bacterium]
MSAGTESVPGRSGWQRVGLPEPATLRDARLQLHWAAQLAAAPGVSLAEPADDHGHMSLCWSSRHAALLGARVGPAGLAIGLAPADLALLLVDGHDSERARLALDGRTRLEALEWLDDTLGAALERDVALALPDHEMPAHPVAGDAGFSLAPGEAFAELSRWYANAYALLTPLRRHERDATPLRCWPHHFDIAFLSLLDGDAAGEEARSVNLGLSPGDGSVDEPYFYVTPWPAPDVRELPALEGGGVWQTEGWTGAVLTASRLLETGDADSQGTRVDAFLRSALRAGHGLLSSTAR